ncbi:hypothetical protein BCR33DRAFT_649159, partial [Rhizoclosmatium globosum]
SPIFQGTPVAATLLMHQAAKIFDKQFDSLLEMSAVFSRMIKEFGYSESGGFLGTWATGVEVIVPVFEKLSETEEARLGSVGIRKRPVGSLKMKGKCTYGCAVVQLMHMQVLKLD